MYNSRCSARFRPASRGCGRGDFPLSSRRPDRRQSACEEDPPLPNTFKGIVYTIASAVIFGITPVLSKLTYSMGSNASMAACFRGLLSLPVLLCILLALRIPLKITRHQLVSVIVCGLVGSTATAITLGIAYNYIPVGMATTLHFIYPVLTTAASVVFLREKLYRYKVVALVLATAGIATFMEPGGSLVGILLALSSGAFYTFYIIWMDKSGLKNLNSFLLTFYLSLVIGPASALYGALTGQFTLSLTATGWALTAVSSLLGAVGAMTLFQLGLRHAGPSLASILSMFEPITSVLMGLLFLGEGISPLKLGGCALILCSVALIALHQRGEVRRPEPEVSEPDGEKTPSSAR
ncbi:DMT family transporter [Acetanaerobacterium sp. MSJ-12]|nr:DMT family transporter [Acetanaerobacterium sp. MSJ-12]